MNEEVAQALMDEWIKELRRSSYQEVLELINNSQSKEINGSDGKRYQLEALAFWDIPGKKHNIRVLVAVDDGTFWRACKPLTTSFIISPDGSFVGQ